MLSDMFLAAGGDCVGITVQGDSEIWDCCALCASSGTE